MSAGSNHGGYQRYFDHLNFVESWCRRHQLVRDQVNSECQSAAASQHQVDVGLSEDVGEEEETMSAGEEIDSEAVEMQLSAELIEFLRISAKHKADRRAAENQTDSQSDQQWFGRDSNDYINADQIGVRSRLAPNQLDLPSIGLAEAKRLQMAQLYGSDGANRVECLEAETQMKFDAKLDRHNSPLWPNIPMRL